MTIKVRATKGNQGQQQGQQQIPFGDDNKKSKDEGKSKGKNKGKSKGKNKMRGSFAALRMTTNLDDN